MEEEEEVEEEEEGFPLNIWKSQRLCSGSQSSQQSGSDIEGGINCAGLAGPTDSTC